MKMMSCSESGGVHHKISQIVFLILLLGNWVPLTDANRPPQFVLSQGQSEIVLRLKEGKETPIGTLIHRLKGFDYEDDPLVFGLRGQIANDLLRIENLGTDEADIYLKKELDRETEESYTLILTLTDGHLGGGSFVTQSLLILVEDVNDNAPICRSDNSSVKVEENSDVPLILTTIECQDLDEGPYGQVIYKLETDPGDEELFSISQTKEGKGILKLLQPLDYDKKFLYQLRVIAMDRANTGQVNTAINPILVEVIDKEDRPPEWLQVPSVTRIPEDIPKGSFVLQVRAIDGDRGVKNKISYSLLNENDLFGMDSETGVLYTKGTLDREDETRNSGSFILQLLATEKTKSNSKSISVSTEVTVLLLDVNDETPRFSSRNYVAEVVENQPVDVPVTFLGDSVAECYDHDLGLNGTFRLYTEGDGGIFEITPSQGINQVSFLVRVKNPSRIDYERLKVINFTLVAEEVGEEKKKSKVGMTVFLRDANDNSPRFEKEIYKVNVNENSPPGTTIVQIRAQDDDSGLLGTEGIRYTSLTGSIAEELILNPITGIITVGPNGKGSLDRELSSAYFLTVEARDSGGRGNRNTVQVQLIINDVNDEPPVFLLSRYEGRVFENELQFVSPLVVEAKDKDLPNTKNSEINYSIVSGNDDGHFEIESNGKIILKRPLNFESLPIIPGHPDSNVKRLNLTLRANDLGSPPLFSIVPLTIWVLDKNDFSPVFKKRVYQKIIREDTASGTEILKLEAEDGDGSVPFNRIFYRMENGAGDKFHIDAEKGTLSLSSGASLDYNTHASYLLHIYAVDGGGLKSSSPALVNISILDTNNKSPQFIVNSSDGVYHAQVKENSPKGTYITQVRATDPDQKPVLRFRLDGNKSEGRSPEGRLIRGVSLSNLFYLDPIDPILRVGGGLDRETLEYVRLTVEVEDKGAENGRQLATAQIQIQIIDEQDNEPVFKKPIYSTSLLENSKSGTVVLTVGADDADLGTHLRYALLPPTSDPDRTEFPLAIDSETGVVSVVHPNKIDREIRQWINFTVLAEDAGSAGRITKGVGRAEVFVRILDQNDNSPNFLAGNDRIELEEDVRVGTVIGNVAARDADEGANGKVSYVLDRKSAMGKFSIDPESGRIRVTSALDREETPSFSLVIQAFDNWYGSPSPDSRSTFKNVLVTLLDVNDSPPSFDGTEDEFHVTEFHEGIIGTIRAKDADAPDSPNSWIQFKIQSGNDLGLFKLEQGKNQAKILPARSLKGFYGNYTLIITAEDTGKPVNSNTKEFYIEITDFNDNSPRFITSQNLTVSVPENATVGSTVVQIRAIDSDTGLNGIVRYRFKKDLTSHSETFTIHPTTGLITLVKPLDRLKIKLYNLRIEAYDLGQIPLSSDLDLRVKVEKVTEFLPIFTIPSVVISFSENVESGEERVDLPETSGSEGDEEEENAIVCYFIIPDQETSSELFQIDPHEHWITPNVILDRERKAKYSFSVVATTNCQGFHHKSTHPASTLNVIVEVEDRNDNSPRFDKRVFSGGISTASSFGSVVVDLSATDLDAPNTPNSELTYDILPPIRMSLTEGLGHLSGNQSQLFLVEGRSILLNFDPQPDMKGFFSMEVGVKDGEGLSDRAVVLIYLLREDQKVKVVVRRNPVEVRNHVEKFLRTLGNITGARVNSDMSSFRFHENADGSVDKTKTDFFIHFVHPEKNIVLEVAEVLRLIDVKIEELDDLFKEFNVIDTQGSTLSPRRSRGLSGEGRSLFLVYASGTAAFLALLLLVVISLACAQRSKYQRRLKAATANAYGSSSTILPRTGNVPNTNVHSGEGSNPIWMQAYHNNWYKEDTHSISGHSESRDSLEDNGVGSSPPSSHSHMRSFLGSDADIEKGRRKISHHTNHHGSSVYHKNLLYSNPIDTNSTCLILKKHLETTEL